LNSAGTVLDPAGFVVDNATGDQAASSVAWNGSAYLVVWSEADGIYARRVGGNGTLLDAAPTKIATLVAPIPGLFRRPVVSAMGADFFVAWAEHRTDNNIYGARVSSAGALIDTTPLPVNESLGDQMDPAVAWNGTFVLVTWRDSRPLTVGTAIYGARISAAGSIQEPAGFVVSDAVGNQLTPAVASDGSNFLVVWWHQSADGGDIYGARVTGAGVSTDLAGVVISNAANQQSSPAVAWNGNRYLVVWEDARGNASDFDVYGARVSTTAGIVVSDPTGKAIGVATRNQQAPTVGANGDFLVAWQDERNNADEIVAARVGDNGVVKDTSGIVVLGSGASAAWAGAAHGADNKWGVVYTKTTASSQHVFLRNVAPK
jgi:hypothetical protein